MRRQYKGGVSALLKLTPETWKAYVCKEIQGVLVYSNRAKCKIREVTASKIVTVIHGEVNEFAVDGGVNLTHPNDHNYKYIRINVIYKNEAEAMSSRFAALHVGRQLDSRWQIPTKRLPDTPDIDKMLKVGGLLSMAANYLRKAAEICGDAYAGWYNPERDLFK